jgi:NodT family efflux transporter outer membrane factor (OMF) lipoprotein
MWSLVSRKMAATAFEMGKRLMKKIICLISFVCVSACHVGPDYVRPPVSVPLKFKEAPKNWKIAKPQICDSRAWWKIFHDPELNKLEDNLVISNQTIFAAEAQYRQACALVDEARASYFPTVVGSLSLVRQKQGSSGSGSSSAGSSTTSTTSSTTSGISTGGISVGGSGGSNGPFTSHSLLLNASWEPDIWGGVSRSVEASIAGAQASGELLAATRLSAEASLAQFYFELRALDKDQALLNDTVVAYKKSLQLTKNRYAAGVAGRADVAQAQSQLETAQAQAINNGILRSQYEHAIAVLIGRPPADFSIAFKPLKSSVPAIPLQVPSMLLERRPDIANAERLMAQANAQIGVAISAYFPTLTLSATGSMQHQGWAHWFSIPAMGWALGAQVAQTIYDGGLACATTAAARANYDASVATYRQAVFTAFQDVEDNLVALRVLKSEMVVQDQAVASARLALKIMLNEYKAGTVPYSNVIIAQTAAYTAEKSAADVRGLEMTAAIGLVKALGGGWDQSG